MKKKNQKLKAQYIPKIEEYFSPLIARCPKLTRNDVSSLTKLVNNCLSILRCYQEQGEIPQDIKLDSYSGLKALINSSQSEEIVFIAHELFNAVESLFLYNIRLVKRILMSIAHVNPQHVTDEMISRSLVAAMRAIFNYDPSRGILLSTYISWYVRRMAGAEYEKAVREFTVNPPSWVSRASVLFNKQNFEKIKAGKSPEEVFGKYTSQYFTTALESKDVVSLYDKTAVDEDIENIIPSDSVTDYQDSSNDFLERIFSIIYLDDVDKKIISMYFGFDGSSGNSIYTIAKEIGKSAEYVRKRLNRALAEIKEKSDAIGQDYQGRN